MYKKEKKREKVFVKFGKITDVLLYTDYESKRTFYIYTDYKIFSISLY